MTDRHTKNIRREHRAIRWFRNNHVPGWRRRIRRIKIKLGRGSKNSTELAQLDRLLTEIRRLIRLHPPYVWGGGHSSTPAMIDHGGDCSSYATHIDQVVAPDVSTGTTFTMAGPGPGLVKGAGRMITHFIKNDPASDAHVITRITHPVSGALIGWTQMGGRDNTKGGAPCWFHPTHERISEFPIQVHPEGL